MIGIKDRGRLPERQVAATKTHRLQNYGTDREQERERELSIFSIDEKSLSPRIRKEAGREKRARNSVIPPALPPRPINSRADELQSRDYNYPRTSLYLFTSGETSLPMHVRR